MRLGMGTGMGMGQDQECEQGPLLSDIFIFLAGGHCICTESTALQHPFLQWTGIISERK